MVRNMLQVEVWLLFRLRGSDRANARRQKNIAIA